MLRRLIWLAVLVGCSVLAGWAGPGLRGAGGPVLLAVTGLVALTGFWWFTIWFLLARRISWRDLFPAAVATRRVLGGHGGRLLGHLLRHGDLG